MPQQPNQVRIEKTKLLLAEGRDGELFLVWACRTYRQQEDVQVVNFGGVNELPTFLKTLSQVENFDSVETLVIARDAESSASSAADSIRGALTGASLPVPVKPFSYASDGRMKVAFVIFPGPESVSGTLEDLCLQIVRDDAIMPCVEEYISCLRAKRPKQLLDHLGKRRMHTFLAGKEQQLIGATIGQASDRKAWDAEHPALQAFRAVIESM